jgi:hypothetical protein
MASPTAATIPATRAIGSRPGPTRGEREPDAGGADEPERAEQRRRNGAARERLDRMQAEPAERERSRREPRREHGGRLTAQRRNRPHGREIHREPRDDFLGRAPRAHRAVSARSALRSARDPR